MGNGELGRLTLERLEIGARFQIQRAFFKTMELEEVADIASNSLRLELRGYLWSNTIHRETERTAVPSTWWDFFKQSCFPDWLKRRMPVRTREITTETKFIHVCPHLEIASRNEERMHFEWLTPPRLSE